MPPSHQNPFVVSHLSNVESIERTFFSSDGLGDKRSVGSFAVEKACRGVRIGPVVFRRACIALRRMLVSCTSDENRMVLSEISVRILQNSSCYVLFSTGRAFRRHTSRARHKADVFLP